MFHKQVMTTATNSTVLEKLASRTGQLYTLPTVAMKVLELTANERVDVPALKDCVANDPALTSKILRVVNSSLFGLPRQVTDLNQALTLLGVKPLKMLVLGFSLPRALFQNVEASVLSRYWRFAFTKSVAGRELAQRHFKCSGDDAFTLGLLHDLGMLAMVQDLGRSYATFIDQAWGSRESLSDLEHSVLGFHHFELTARMLLQWNMPKSFVQVIESAQDANTSSELAQILRLADHISQLVVAQKSYALETLLGEGQRFRNLAWDDIQSLVSSLQAKVDDIATAFSVQLPRDVDYETILTSAHVRLAREAEQAVFVRNEPEPIRVVVETDHLRQEAERYAREPSAISGSATVPGPTPPLRPQAVPTTSEPGLPTRLATSLTRCRNARAALSVVIVEIEGYRDLVFELGLETAERIRLRVADLAKNSLEASWVAPVSEVGLAAACEGCDRSQAVGRSKIFKEEVKRIHSSDQIGHPVVVSIGIASVAVPPKNFPGDSLLVAANRCVAAVRASGGDGVKSIDL